MQVQSHRKFYADLRSVQETASRLKVGLQLVDCGRRSYLCAGWTTKESEDPGLLFYQDGQWSESFHDVPEHRESDSHVPLLERWLEESTARHGKVVYERARKLDEMRAHSAHDMMPDMAGMKQGQGQKQEL